jgi:hypothetical protein
MLKRRLECRYSTKKIDVFGNCLYWFGYDGCKFRGYAKVKGENLFLLRQLKSDPCGCREFQFAYGEGKLFEVILTSKKSAEVVQKHLKRLENDQKKRIYIGDWDG